MNRIGHNRSLKYTKTGNVARVFDLGHVSRLSPQKKWTVTRARRFLVTSG